MYMRHLMSMHEIVVCDAFLEFINEEFLSTIPGSPNNLRTTLVESSSEIDLLLENEIPITTTVRTEVEASFIVKPGELVVWRFSTAAYE